VHHDEVATFRHHPKEGCRPAAWRTPQHQQHSMMLRRSHMLAATLSARDLAGLGVHEPACRVSMFCEAGRRVSAGTGEHARGPLAVASGPEGWSGSWDLRF
jgi:hypothetical protein